MKRKKIETSSAPIVCYYGRDDRDNLIWWQDNWSCDQWEVVDEKILEIMIRTAVMLRHQVVKGLPNDD